MPLGCQRLVAVRQCTCMQRCPGEWYGILGSAGSAGASFTRQAAAGQSAVTSHHHHTIKARVVYQSAPQSGLELAITRTTRSIDLVARSTKQQRAKFHSPISGRVPLEAHAGKHCPSKEQEDAAVQRCRPPPSAAAQHGLSVCEALGAKVSGRRSFVMGTGVEGTPAAALALPAVTDAAPTDVPAHILSVTRNPYPTPPFNRRQGPKSQEGDQTALRQAARKSENSQKESVCWICICLDASRAPEASCWALCGADRRPHPPAQTPAQKQSPEMRRRLGSITKGRARAEASTG